MSEQMLLEIAVDLSNCGREPIHIPGAILPHGAMLVVHPHTFQVMQAAGDTAGLIGIGVDQLIGKPLESFLQPEQVGRLRELCATSELLRPRHLLDPILRIDNAHPLDASIHRSDGALVIEFEQADIENFHAADPLNSVQDLLAGLDSAASLHDACQLVAGRIRALTGYDRVMIYRFMEDGAGWVFAESRKSGLEPFLDLHYPATDIPEQARALYRKNWLRLIKQVDYEPAPLTPPENPLTGRPLDMSQATLRDVSPIHREYLRNMGVDASMSISILREGKLWGLIACHHYSPHFLPRHLRAICEQFGSMFSLQLEARERATQFEAHLVSRKALQVMMRDLAHEDDYAVALADQVENLLYYIEAGGLALRSSSGRGGVAVRTDSGITVLGNTPTGTQIAALTDWLSTQMTSDGNGVFITDRLGELWPPAKAFAEVASGILAISMSREPRDFILWFRPELIQAVKWGGNPDKPVEAGTHGDRLMPRKSFAIWQQTVRGRSSAWRASDGDAAFDLRMALFEIVLRRIDAAARERQRGVEHQDLLMAELDHRVKNVLANVQALVSQASRNAGSLEEFILGLQNRIQSMSRAHTLLSESRWESLSIRMLLEQELNQFRERFSISSDGSEIMLKPKSALSLSLAIHELATNAAKYGALSTPHGRLTVEWEVKGSGDIAMRWREWGGPPVSPPKRRGFGSTLIERALAMETGGSSEISFNPEGVTCEIFLPAASLTKVLLTETRPAPTGTESATQEVVLADEFKPRILVVEDSALVAILIEDLLQALGWDIVGPASTVTQALELVRAEQIDAAMLDVNLFGQMSWDVATALKQRGVPFIFTTGYTDGTIIPPPLADAVVVSKPFHAEEIELQLRKLIAKAAPPQNSIMAPQAGIPLNPP